MSIKELVSLAGVDEEFTHHDGKLIFGFKLASGVHMAIDFLRNANTASLYKSAKGEHKSEYLTSEEEAKTAYKAFYGIEHGAVKKKAVKTKE